MKAGSFLPLLCILLSLVSPKPVNADEASATDFLFDRYSLIENKHQYFNFGFQSKKLNWTKESLASAWRKSCGKNLRELPIVSPPGANSPFRSYYQEFKNNEKNRREYHWIGPSNPQVLKEMQKRLPWDSPPWELDIDNQRRLWTTLSPIELQLLLNRVWGEFIRNDSFSKKTRAQIKAFLFWTSLRLRYISSATHEAQGTRREVLSLGNKFWDSDACEFYRLSSQDQKNILAEAQGRDHLMHLLLVPRIEQQRMFATLLSNDNFPLVSHDIFQLLSRLESDLRQQKGTKPLQRLIPSATDALLIATLSKLEQNQTNAMESFKRTKADYLRRLQSHAKAKTSETLDHVLAYLNAKRARDLLAEQDIFLSIEHNDYKLKVGQRAHFNIETLKGLKWALSQLGLESWLDPKRGPLQIGNKVLLPAMKVKPYSIPIIALASYKAFLAHHHQVKEKYLAALEAHGIEFTGDGKIQFKKAPDFIALSNDSSVSMALEHFMPGLQSQILNKKRDYALLVGGYVFHPRSRVGIDQVSVSTPKNHKAQLKRTFDAMEQEFSRIEAFLKRNQGILNFDQLRLAVDESRQLFELKADEKIALMHIRNLGSLGVPWKIRKKFLDRTLSLSELKAQVYQDAKWTLGATGVAAMIAVPAAPTAVVAGTGLSIVEQGARIFDGTQREINLSQAIGGGIAVGTLGTLAKLSKPGSGILLALGTGSSTMYSAEKFKEGKFTEGSFHAALAGLGLYAGSRMYNQNKIASGSKGSPPSNGPKGNQRIGHSPLGQTPARHQQANSAHAPKQFAKGRLNSKKKEVKSNEAELKKNGAKTKPNKKDGKKARAVAKRTQKEAKPKEKTDPKPSENLPEKSEVTLGEKTAALAGLLRAPRLLQKQAVLKPPHQPSGGLYRPHAVPDKASLQSIPWISKFAAEQADEQRPPAFSEAEAVQIGDDGEVILDLTQLRDLEEGEKALVLSEVEEALWNGVTEDESDEDAEAALNMLLDEWQRRNSDRTEDEQKDREERAELILKLRELEKALAGKKYYEKLAENPGLAELKEEIIELINGSAQKWPDLRALKNAKVQTVVIRDGIVKKIQIETNHQLVQHIGDIRSNSRLRGVRMRIDEDDDTAIIAALARIEDLEILPGSDAALIDDILNSTVAKNLVALAITNEVVTDGIITLLVPEVLPKLQKLDIVIAGIRNSDVIEKLVDSGYTEEENLIVQLIELSGIWRTSEELVEKGGKLEVLGQADLEMVLKSKAKKLREIHLTGPVNEENLKPLPPHRGITRIRMRNVSPIKEVLEKLPEVKSVVLDGPNLSEQLRAVSESSVAPNITEIQLRSGGGDEFPTKETIDELREKFPKLGNLTRSVLVLHYGSKKPDQKNLNRPTGLLSGILQMGLREFRGLRLNSDASSQIQPSFEEAAAITINEDGEVILDLTKLRNLKEDEKALTLTEVEEALWNGVTEEESDKDAEAALNMLLDEWQRPNPDRTDEEQKEKGDRAELILKMRELAKIHKNKKRYELSDEDYENAKKLKKELTELIQRCAHTWPDLIALKQAKVRSVVLIDGVVQKIHVSTNRVLVENNKQIRKHSRLKGVRMRLSGSKNRAFLTVQALRGIESLELEPDPRTSSQLLQAILTSNIAKELKNLNVSLSSGNNANIFIPSMFPELISLQLGLGFDGDDQVLSTLKERGLIEQLEKLVIMHLRTELMSAKNLRVVGTSELTSLLQAENESLTEARVYDWGIRLSDDLPPNKNIRRVVISQADRIDTIAKALPNVSSIILTPENVAEDLRRIADSKLSKQLTEIQLHTSPELMPSKELLTELKEKMPQLREISQAIPPFGSN